MDEKKKRGEGAVLIERIVHWSILGLAPLAMAVYGFAYLTYADRCTGTSSADFARTFLCRQSNGLVSLDCTIVTLVIVGVWLRAPRGRALQAFQVLALLYLFVGRLWLLGQMAQTYVVPFYPG